MSSSGANALTFCIAIPIFGQADLLPTALASLAAQNVNLNIAVMDASADDAAQDVLNAHGTLPIAYRRHGPDSGQAAAIQEGWKAVQGDILSWLNADDYLVAGCLEVVEDLFKANPQADVVYGDAVFVDRSGRFNTYFPSISENIADLRFHCCISQPACFVRRAAVERVNGVNTKLHYIMDWDLWTRLYLSGAKFHYVQRPLAVVRMYAETKTASGGRKRLIEISAHLKEHAPFLKRIRSTLAFAVEARAMGRAFQLVIDGYRIGKRFVFGVFGKQRVKQVYGIESHCNRVHAEARVCLPWYGERSVRRLEIVARTRVDVGAELNNNSLTRESTTHIEGGLCRMIFKIPNDRVNDNLFDIRLRSDGSEPWVLLSVSVD